MTDAHDASVEAAHKAKNAQQAVEMAREAQNQEMVDKTAAKVLEGLKEIFTDDTEKDPQQMSILIQRVPILCTTVLQMHEDIKSLKDSQTWAVRIVIGAVIVGVMTTILK